jgi:predicted  nucleic acid-binding Zn-ribbon protein
MSLDCFRKAGIPKLQELYESKVKEGMSEQEMFDIGAKIAIDYFNELEGVLVKARRAAGQKVKASPVKYEPAPKPKKEEPVKEQPKATEKDEQSSPAKVPPSETKAKKSTTAQKEAAFKSIDEIASRLKEKFKVDLPEGTKKMGYTQDDLIDLIANISKAIAATGIEINAAIKKVVAELVDMGAIAKEEELDYAMAARVSIETSAPPTTKQTVKDYDKSQSTVREEAKERVYGIINELAPKDVLDESQDQRDSLRKTKEEFAKIGRDLVDSGVINPAILIDEIIANPRALQPEEQAALIYYATLIANEIDILSERIEQNVKDGDKVAESNNRLLLAQKVADDRNLDRAGILAGVIQGQSLWIRRMLMNSKFKTSVQQAIYTSDTGRNFMPPEYLDKIKEAEKKIRDLEKKQQEHEKKIEELNKKLRAPTKKTDGLSADKKNRLAELRPKFFGAFNDATRIAAILVDKEFYEYSKLLLEQAGGDVKVWATKMYSNVGKKVKKYLPEIYQKITGKQMVVGEIEGPSIDQDGELNIPNEYIIDLIEQGFDTIQTIVPELMKVMEDFGLDVTERQVMDAVSDYGKRTQLSTDKVNVALRKMKRVGKLLAALEDVQAKKRPKRSGKERDKLDAEERDLMRKINHLLRDLPQTNEEVEAKWKTALEAAKARMRNRIEQINKQLATGEKTPKRIPIVYDAEAQELKDELDFLNKLLRAQEGANKLTYEQRVRMIETALKKRRDYYVDKIRNKDFDLPTTEKIETPNIKRLREEVAALKEEFEKLRDAEQPDIKQRAINDRRLKHLSKKIEEAEKLLSEKVFAETKRKAKPQYDARVKAAQEYLNDLRNQIKDLDEYKELAEKKKLELTKKNLRKSIERYKEMIAKGEFTTAKPEAVKLDEEGKKLKIEQIRWMNKMNLEREKATLAARNAFQRFGDNFIDVLGLPRTLMASVDFSAPLRQGLILTVRNPKIAARALKQMFLQAVSEFKYEQWLDELEGTEEYQYAKSVGLYIAKPNSVLLAKEEQFVSSIASKIPVYGKLVRGSERAYSSYLNVLRMGVFHDFYHNMQVAGLDPILDKDTFKYMARFINNATGRGNIMDMGVGEKALNALFFSPRYVISRFNILFNTPIFLLAEIPGASGITKYPKEVRREALKTMLAFSVIQSLVMLLAAAAGAEVEDDPRSANFMKIKFGNITFDTWSGFQQIVKTVSVVASAKKKNAVTGKITDLNTGGYKTPTRADEVFSFFRKKLSPVASIMVDALYAPKGQYKEQSILFGNITYTDKVGFQDVMGQNLTYTDKILSLMIPLYFQDMYEIYKNEGIAMTSAALFPALFGVGTQYMSPAGNGAVMRDLEEMMQDFEIPEIELNEVEMMDFDAIMEAYDTEN